MKLKKTTEQPVHYLDEPEDEFHKTECRGCGNALIGHEKYHDYCFDCGQEKNLD